MQAKGFTDRECAEFDRDGYFVARALFSDEETDLLRKIAKADQAIVAGADERLDKDGNVSRIALCNSLGEDTYSAIARSQRMVSRMEQLLGGEVYHYHHKMSQKEPRVGGAWEWHQDYGYWYNNGCLFPHMASCMIAVDAATKENGCLQVIRGSHHMGRVEHGTVGEQTGADPERVEQAHKRMDLVYCELNPGDAVFFHCNLFHRSDANTSPHPRWTLICCYNAARNDPYKKHHHPNYYPLEVWPDERVLETARAEWSAMTAEAN